MNIQKRIEEVQEHYKQVSDYRNCAIRAAIYRQRFNVKSYLHGLAEALAILEVEVPE